MEHTKRFSGLLITSDFDSTFFERGFIPQRNIEATKYFMENGGLFTINTARPVDSISEYLPMFEINSPAVLCNGAVIYDYQKEEILDITYMDKDAIELAREIYEKFETVGIELYTDREKRTAREDQVLSPAASKHRPKGKKIDIYTFDEPLTRIVFIAEEETIMQVCNFVEKNNSDRFEQVKSFNKFFNLMAKGVSKGSGLVKLSKILGIGIEKTIAIGDNFNDIGMLRAAGFSVCPNNSREEIKDMCNLVVGDMMEGAVADLIDYLDKMREGIL